MTEASDLDEGELRPATSFEELSDRVVVRLTRRERRNAIVQQMVDELHAACARLEAEPRVAAGRLGRTSAQGFFTW